MSKKGEHHGGAWKVAYADFVTAMMALFMVLWIVSQDKRILLATALYFNKRPFILADKSNGMMQSKNGGSQTDSEIQESSAAKSLAFLNQVANEINRLLNVRESTDKPVDVEVTSDGLKVTLYDRSKQPIFEKNTARLTTWGTFAMQNMAWLIERNKLRVVIDGHAPSGIVMPTKDYSLWELTADRANSARRALEFYAVSPSKIGQVSGFADTRPMANVPANSETNQRLAISLTVP